MVSTRLKIALVSLAVALVMSVTAPLPSHAASVAKEIGAVSPVKPVSPVTISKQLPRTLTTLRDFANLDNITNGVTFAAYGNYVRLWGIVSTVYSDGTFHLDTNGNRVWDVLPTWMAFEMTGADFIPQRWECGFYSSEPTPEQLACTEVLEGDSILLNAHLASRLTQDFDGPASFPSANGIYRCQGTQPDNLSGPCVLLTP